MACKYIKQTHSCIELWPFKERPWCANCVNDEANRTIQRAMIASYVGEAPAHITYGELGALVVLLSRQYPAGPQDLPVDDGLAAATLLCS